MDTGPASQRLQGAGIDRFTLRFAEPALERRYRQEDTLANRVAVHQWSIWGIVGFIAIGIFEWRTLGAHALVPMIVRYGAGLPVFIVNYTLSFIIDYERFFIRINPISMISAGLTTIVAGYLAPAEFHDLYWCQFLAVELFLYLHPGVSFRVKVQIGWSACAAFLAMIALAGRFDLSPETIEESSLLVVANVMAMFGAYTSELATRRLFRANLVVAQQRHQDRDMHQKLSMANRLEAVGRLAGGVAHDFNNLMQIIASSAYLVGRKAVGSAIQVKGELEAVDTAVRRGSDLTWRLLAFSRQQPSNKGVTDLRRVVDEIRQMLERTIEKNISLRVDVPADEPFFIMANPGAMDQVLLNLAINACDAMPEGGEVRIALRHVAGLPHTAPAHAGEGPFIRIDVSDQGVGIPGAIKDKVFDPFFTTKEFGKGSGLGLSIVFGIVNDHGGQVVLSDAQPRGTTASVYIPACDAPGAVVERAEPRAAGPSSRSILLAEDEADLAAALRTVLESAGNRVVVAANGLEAIAAIERNPGSFDLAVLDVAMPAADGIAVYAALRKASASLPVIFSSGFRSTRLEPAILRDPHISFLDKPYSPEELLRRIDLLMAPRP